MASESEIEEVLIMLQAAYPHYKPVSVEAMVDLYTRKLGRFSAEALRQAADQVIDESKFFPQISELVERASRIKAPVVVAQGVDQLAALRQELEDRFYQGGELERQEWANLVRALEAAGRSSGAVAIWERVEALEGKYVAVR